jgi:TonB family protein
MSLSISGTVKLTVVVEVDGKPGKIVEIGPHLGYGLEEAAIEAVKLVRFKPAKRGEQAVEDSVTFEIKFDLARTLPQGATAREVSNEQAIR